MKPIDKEAIERRLLSYESRNVIEEAVFYVPLNDYLVTVGEMELVPVIRGRDNESRQVFDVCLRSPSSEKIVPVVFDCKHLQEATDWIERLKYIVMVCCEGKP